MVTLAISLRILSPIIFGIFILCTASLTLGLKLKCLQTMHKSCNAFDDLVWLSKLWVKLGSIQICYLICPYVVRWKSHTSYKSKSWKYEFPAQYALCVQQICCVCFKLILQGSNNQFSINFDKDSLLCGICPLCLYAWIFTTDSLIQALSLTFSSPSYYTVASCVCKKGERYQSPFSLCSEIYQQSFWEPGSPWFNGWKS